ncbi:hypothetical protein CW304_06155 [Bacillus sp. UFRGS-B20]|nr:hypothetical protein CW304_06155 [Bacillus sp. UFRGS-B20]
MAANAISVSSLNCGDTMVTVHLNKWIPRISKNLSHVAHIFETDRYLKPCSFIFPRTIFKLRRCLGRSHSIKFVSK